LKTFEESDEIGGKKWGILKMKANVWMVFLDLFLDSAGWWRQG
jgi:hypothetical protein